MWSASLHSTGEAVFLQTYPHSVYQWSALTVPDGDLLYTTEREIIVPFSGLLWEETSM